MKRCSGCRRRLPESEFYADRARRDGLCSYCKPCKLKRQRDRYHGLTEGRQAFYSLDDLLSRPIEHTIESFTTDEIARATGLCRSDAGAVKAYGTSDESVIAALRTWTAVRMREALEGAVA